MMHLSKQGTKDLGHNPRCHGGDRRMALES
jgi:hypothetical protein